MQIHAGPCYYAKFKYTTENQMTKEEIVIGMHLFILEIL